MIFFPLGLHPSQQKSSRLGQSASMSVPHLVTCVTVLLESHWWPDIAETEGLTKKGKERKTLFKQRTKRPEFFFKCEKYKNLN
jgi:hypothetical protein